MSIASIYSECHLSEVKRKILLGITNLRAALNASICNLARLPSFQSPSGPDALSPAELGPRAVPAAAPSRGPTAPFPRSLGFLPLTAPCPPERAPVGGRGARMISDTSARHSWPRTRIGTDVIYANLNQYFFVFQYP